MAKKKKGAKQSENSSAAPSPSPAPEPSTPTSIPTPSVSSSAPSNGSNTPTERAAPSEMRPEEVLAAADALKERGNVAFKAKKFDEAIKLYTEAIEMAPMQPAYYTNRAAASMAIKQFSPALQDCQQARTLQQAAPQVKTLQRLARCQLATGSPGPAMSTIREAQNLGGELKEIIQLKQNAETMQRHLESVTKAKENGEWNAAQVALEVARAMLEGEGKDVPTEWRCWTGEFRMARGEWDSAMEAVREALRFETNSPDLYALCGQILFLTNKPTESTTILRRALTLDPENGTARKMLKRVKELEKIKDEGNAAFRSGRFEEAVLKYTEALDVVGTDSTEGKGGIIRAVLLSNRATAYNKAKDYEKAIADLDISLELYPENWKAVRTRGRIWLAKDDYEQALSDLREALELAEANHGNESAEADIKEEIRRTEVLLKRSKEKDYYKILGIPRSATESEIKKAYRKESLIHHPDKGGIEDRFKLVVEANAVLSDPEKRRRYDMGEDIDGQMNGDGPGGFPGGVDISELLFAQMFGGGRGGGFGGRGGFGGPFGGGGFGGGGSRHGHSHMHGFGF